jgi:EAL domain-containing protein (putative c-di-GMP-specific phosphodiesterase class I)/CRP-like cAMP-binding protein
VSTVLPKKLEINNKYRKVFYPGGIVFREGEAADCAYIVESGRVEISTLVAGEQTALATLGPGELFGEMALVDEGVRTATATALDRVELVVISQSFVKAKLEQADPMISLFLRVIMERFRGWRDRVNPSEALLEPAERYRSVEYEEHRHFVQEVARLNRDLHLALDSQQFDIFYQPIIALGDGAVRGFEALVRWHHPVRGLVQPNDFIGLAEETGLIVPLGAQVMREACRGFQRILEAARQHRSHAGDWFISINVSPRQVGDEGFLDHLEQTLAETGLSPGRIKLEITEGLLMQNPEAAVHTLRHVKSLGFLLAIDDFGTGYSSLSYLHRFPMDTLKIDRSFVKQTGDVRNRKIVEAIVGLARGMDLTVIAEGIEAQGDHDYLHSIGVELGQGYLISRPVPEAQLAGFLAGRA